MRKRKTGPRHALLVAGCGVHDRRFTLYPPGHLPYGRKAIAPVASDGAPIAAAGPPIAAFETTCFGAAIDAAAGKPWPRGSAGITVSRWSTQRRELAREVTWLGVAPDFPDDLRAAVAAALGVPLLLLRDESRAVAARPGYRSRGSAVCNVLRAVLGRGSVCDRLAGAAHAAGLVGLPLRWDTRAGTLRAPPSFRWPGTRAPPRPRPDG